MDFSAARRVGEPTIECGFPAIGDGGMATPILAILEAAVAHRLMSPLRPWAKPRPTRSVVALRQATSKRTV
jgi:hypothetical protein